MIDPRMTSQEMRERRGTTLRACVRFQQAAAAYALQGRDAMRVGNLPLAIECQLRAASEAAAARLCLAVVLEYSDALVWGRS